MKRYKLHITRRSVNTIKEIQSYKWRKDRAGNILQDQPVKFMDDSMAAMRYGIHSHRTRESFSVAFEI